MSRDAGLIPVTIPELLRFPRDIVTQPSETGPHRAHQYWTASAETTP